VADSNYTYDECGVCLAPTDAFDEAGDACRGCDGIVYVRWNGPTYDACGVCGGDGASCLSGCDMQPHSAATYDECGVCGGDNSFCAPRSSSALLWGGIGAAIASALVLAAAFGCIFGCDRQRRRPRTAVEAAEGGGSPDWRYAAQSNGADIRRRR
jgi:hypothetical protein